MHQDYGEPTAEYKLLFELAAENYHQLIAAIKPGVCGKDLAPVLAGKAAQYGYKSLSCITGWSTFNSRPVLFARRTDPADWELEMKAGLCLNVAGWIVDKDERMGVWVGDTIALTDTGVRRLHRSPIADLAANTLGG